MKVIAFNCGAQYSLNHLNLQGIRNLCRLCQPRRYVLNVVASGGGGFGPTSTARGRGTKKAPQETTETKPKGFDSAPTAESDVRAAVSQEAGGTGGAGQATTAASPSLQAAPRDEVIAACLQTSALIAVLGFGLHQLAPLISPAVRDGGDEALKALLQWPTLPTAWQGGVALATAGTVTAARLALLAAWPAFRDSTDTSNRQVLSLLSGPSDVLLVSLLPAVAEELLFRGALLPSIYPDWRGAAIAGAVFGVLHVNGGRNAAFGAWAAAVGVAYGLAFVETGNLLVPVAAHGLANIASSYWWLSQNPSQKSA